MTTAANLEYSIEEMFAQQVSEHVIVYQNLFQHIDKSPVFLILWVKHYHLSFWGYMNWNDLSPEEQTLINNEEAQFIYDINTRPEVEYVLSMNPSLNSVLSTIKMGCSYSSHNAARTITEYKWHAQREINIYFRYGCELIHFCMNTSVQPMVKFTNESNLVVPPGEGDCSLPEYFEKYKNGLAPVRDNPETQKNIFGNVMAHNFLRGKIRFLRRFCLEESPGFTLSTEQLYFSYYIVWQGLSGHHLLSLNPVDIGKDFLGSDSKKSIVFKEPKDPIITDGFDITERMLLGGRKNYEVKEEVDKIYSKKLPYVFQRTAHTFPDFEKTVYPNGEIKKGLLGRIKDEFYKLKKREDPKIFKPKDWSELIKYREEFEVVIKSIVYDIKCEPAYTPGNENKAEQCLRELNDSYNRDACELPGILQDCCKLEQLPALINDYENKKRFLNKMWNNASIKSATSIDAPRNNGDNRSILDIFDGEEDKSNEQDEPPYIIPLTSAEGNHTLFLLFQVAFAGDNIFLNELENNLNKDPKNFRDNLYKYVKLHGTKGINVNVLQTIYKDYLAHLGGTVTQKDIDDFNEKIRHEVLLPLFSENVILYGRERLKEVFRSKFFHERAFIAHVSDIIDNSFNRFDELMRSLASGVSLTQKESELRKDYQEILYPDNPDLPPFIDELDLRREINEFINRGTRASGGFWKIRNEYLKSFPCFQNEEWEDLLYKEYIKRTVNPIPKKIYKERIWEI